MNTAELKTWLSAFPSAAEKEVAVREFSGSDETLRELFDLSLKSKDPVAWRAAWVLDGCDEYHPGLASPFLREIIARLSGIISHGVLRSLLRMLCRYDIEEEDQGTLIDRCFSYMVSELYPVAIKVYAMEIIFHHVLIYPELKQELETVIRDQTVNNTAGFMTRGRRILARMEKLEDPG